MPFTAPQGNRSQRLCSLFPGHCSITDTMRSWRYEEHSSFLNSNIPEQNFLEFYFSESDHSILLNEPLRISADWQWVHWPRLTAWSSGYPHKNTRTQGSCPYSRHWSWSLAGIYKHNNTVEGDFIMRVHQPGIPSQVYFTSISINENLFTDLL